uniref:UDP-3-O-(3-hydroxymyristoyl)glucosamine N-acyltransferase n=1 Tax=Candidatus Symbiothrix dinenymphae TaxID=467085 RepID=UPI000703BE92
MEFSAQQIACILDGKIEGNATAKVSNFSKIDEGKTGTITFLSNPKYAHHLYDTQASIALINDDFVLEQPVPQSLTLIRVPDAYSALARLLEMASQEKPRKQGIEQPSFIHPSVKIGVEQAVPTATNVYIGAFAYIGENVTLGENVSIYPQSYIGDNVTIGSNTMIYAGVKIYDGCVIGNNCIIHAGAVIGSDGFGFAKEGDSFRKIPQLGNVVVEDDVEIGANSTIDRAVMDVTAIRKGAKLDNLIHI